MIVPYVLMRFFLRKKINIAMAEKKEIKEDSLEKTSGGAGGKTASSVQMFMRKADKKGKQ